MTAIIGAWQWLVNRYYLYTGLRALNKIMRDGMYRIAMGHLFVFREAPSWALLWVHHMGKPPGENELAVQAYEQAMTELQLRMRPLLAGLKELLRRAHPDLPEEAYETISMQHMNDLPLPTRREPVLERMIASVQKALAGEDGGTQMIVEHVSLDEAWERGMIDEHEYLHFRATRGDMGPMELAALRAVGKLSDTQVAVATAAWQARQDERAAKGEAKGEAAPETPPEEQREGH